MTFCLALIVFSYRKDLGLPFYEEITKKLSHPLFFQPGMGFSATNAIANAGMHVR
jgi:hypothetical protein